MDPLVLAGYVSALAVGACLGLLGGGGSILTIPVLVYLFGIAPLQATGYSLFLVGVVALAGTIGYSRKGWLDMRVAAVFVAPSVLAVYLTRHYLLPWLPETLAVSLEAGARPLLLLLLIAATVGAFLWIRAGRPVHPDFRRALLLAIPAVVAVYAMRRLVVPSLPEELFGIAGFALARDQAIMLLLAIVMLITGALMLRRRNEVATDADVPLQPLMLTLQGVLVGGLTGIIGAGGGFLITPALIAFARLPVKVAVGTSLLIISVNSLAGFAGDLGHAEIRWGFLLGITGLALAGLLAGMRLAARIPGHALRKALGVLLVGLAVAIFALEGFGA